MSNQSDDSSFNTSSWDEAVIRRMDESIVAQRHQMNQTSLKFRHLALNAEGKRALNSISLEHLAANDRNRYIQHLFLLSLTDLLEQEMNQDLIRQFNSSSSSDDSSLSTIPSPSIYASSFEIEIESSNNSSIRTVDNDDESMASPLNLSFDSNVSSIRFSSMSTDSSSSEELFYERMEEFNAQVNQSIFNFSMLMQISSNEIASICLKTLDLVDIRRTEYERARLDSNTPPIRRTIDSLTDAEARDLTRFTKEQLHELYDLFFDDLQEKNRIDTSGQRQYFTAEFALLIGLTYAANGTKYSMLKNTFGGNYVSYTYPINWLLNDFLHNKYYNRISGNSLDYWKDDIEEFRRSCYDNICFDITETGSVELMFPDINFDCWRIAGFLDCKQEKTAVPGSGPLDEAGTRRRNADAIQQGYFTHYGKMHGLKTQALLWPNGMMGHVFNCPVSHNDKGVLNMSGLEENMKDKFPMLDACIAYPSLYADDIYDPSLVIVIRGDPEECDKAFYQRCNMAREKIEHEFGAYAAKFKLLRFYERHRILLYRKDLAKRFISLYFILNCYTCLNGNNTSCKFFTSPPTLEEYLSGPHVPYDDDDENPGRGDAMNW